jgi:selenide,water dikinase
VLRQLPAVSDPNLLVGFASEDDAAVYRMDDDLAVIQTVDFFPPIVDEPFSYGEIAVANAVSDVYAMGGRPLLGLNIVGFPADLSKDVLVQILKGGASKASEAGLLIVGGHTIDDKEPKYGLAVTGVIKPGAQVTNAGARPGDSLVLTKPIGTGIITTAGKHQQAPSQALNGAIEAMTALNRAASEAMVAVGVSACVDVTGFGLIGHLLGMAKGSDVGARISLSSIPLLEGVRELIKQDIAPSGTRRNLTSADRFVLWDPAIDDPAKLLLCDAQTSGGLLISVPQGQRDRLLAALESRGVETRAVIGEILSPDSLGDRRIHVTE